MQPELFTFQIGTYSHTIMAYSFFYTLATLVVVGGTFVIAVHKGINKKHMVILLMAITMSGFVSARLWHIVTNWSLYASKQMSMYAWDMEGFAIVGGLIGAIISGYIVSRILHMNFWMLGDLSVIFLGIGIALARIGCFLNGCCFGHIANLPWSVRFPVLSSAHKYQIVHGEGSIFGTYAVHPTQIYELVAALIGSVIAWYLMKKKYPHGVAIAAFGIWFATFRLINMHFRVFPDSLHVSWGFYPLIYSTFIIACCAIVAYKVFIKK